MGNIATIEKDIVAETKKANEDKEVAKAKKANEDKAVSELKEEVEK